MSSETHKWLILTAQYWSIRLTELEILWSASMTILMIMCTIEMAKTTFMWHLYGEERREKNSKRLKQKPCLLIRMEHFEVSTDFECRLTGIGPLFNWLIVRTWKGTEFQDDQNKQHSNRNFVPNLLEFLDLIPCSWISCLKFRKTQTQMSTIQMELRQI